MPQKADNKAIAFGQYRLDPKRRTLFRGEEPITLQAKAFDLLYFLATNPGRILSKDEILAVVWQGQFVEEANLSVQISSIRKVLGENASDPRYLVTIPGKGYQFIADVSVAGDAPGGKAPRNGGAKRWLQIVAPTVLLGLALIIGAVYWFYSASAKDWDIQMIAVLPFRVEASGASEAYLGEGLSEGMIDALAVIPGLRVLSSDSSFRLNQGDQDIYTASRELNVDALLSGTVSRNDDGYLVRVELVSTRDRSVIWARSFVRNGSDIKILHTDVARTLGAALKREVKQTGQEFEVSDEGFRRYLAGRYHLNRLTDDGFNKAKESFRSAIETDPGFAPAHAGLAEAYNLLSGWGSLAPNDGYPLAKAAAIRALELNESLPDAHSALGTVKLFYDLDHAGARVSIDRAIELNPNHSDALMMDALARSLRGDFVRARESASRSVEIDPVSIVKHVSLGNVSYFERNYERALTEYQKAIDLDPNSGLARWARGNSLVGLGRTEEAIDEYRRAIDLSGDSPDEPASLAIAYSIAGRRSEADAVVAQLLGRGDRFVPKGLVAGVYAHLGKKDAAFEMLEEAFRERDSLLPYLKVEPMFDPLRDDPRFALLLARAGL